MKKKSKFIVFILSPIPGLSHLYLGWSQRALIFFMIFLGICMGGTVLGSMRYSIGGNMAVGITFFALALIWFIAFSEALHLADQNKSLNTDGSGDQLNNPSPNYLFSVSNRKIIAIAFSAIPGAGHMYLGLLKQGAQLMAGFFFILFITGWLNMGLIAFIVPVIWFYSLFDVYHLLEEEDELRLDASTLFDWFSTHPQWVGWGLILLGLLVVLQRIVSPLLEPILTANLRSYIETSFVALILFAGGIKLLMGSKSNYREEEN